MTDRKMLDHLVTLIAQLEQRLDKKVCAAVQESMNEYRRSYIQQADKWCCRPMTDFAKEIWQLAAPRREDGLGSVTLSLRNHHVVYCPFCGVKL